LGVGGGGFYEERRNWGRHYKSEARRNFWEMEREEKSFDCEGRVQKISRLTRVQKGKGSQHGVLWIIVERRKRVNLGS